MLRHATQTLEDPPRHWAHLPRPVSANVVPHLTNGDVEAQNIEGTGRTSRAESPMANGVLTPAGEDENENPMVNFLSPIERESRSYFFTFAPCLKIFIIFLAFAMALVIIALIAAILLAVKSTVAREATGAQDKTSPSPARPASFLHWGFRLLARVPIVSHYTCNFLSIPLKFLWQRRSLFHQFIVESVLNTTFSIIATNSFDLYNQARAAWARRGEIFTDPEKLSMISEYGPWKTTKLQYLEKLAEDAKVALLARIEMYRARETDAQLQAAQLEALFRFQNDEEGSDTTDEESDEEGSDTTDEESDG